MIEDREEMPQRLWGRDASDERPRHVLEQPPASCRAHAHGRCQCEDDGSGAAEHEQEERVR